MRNGILGTGMVGQAIGTRLVLVMQAGPKVWLRLTVASKSPHFNFPIAR